MWWYCWDVLCIPEAARIVCLRLLYDMDAIQRVECLQCTHMFDPAAYVNPPGSPRYPKICPKCNGGNAPNDDKGEDAISWYAFLIALSGSADFLIFFRSIHITPSYVSALWDHNIFGHNISPSPPSLSEGISFSSLSSCGRTWLPLALHCSQGGAPPAPFPMSLVPF